MAHFTDKSTKTSTFKLDEPEFNMNMYSGRVRHFFKVFNPM